jgi:hypothetical protein
VLVLPADYRPSPGLVLQWDMVYFDKDVEGRDASFPVRIAALEL